MSIVSYAKQTPEPGIGFVYKWTNKLNGMMYIGSHGGNNPNYITSGKHITYAINKYGIENFEREILYCGPVYREVEEEILLAIDAAAEHNGWYNLTNAAKGVHKGYRQTPEHSSRISESLKGMPKSAEHNRKNSEAHLGLLVGKRNGMFGVRLTGELNGFYKREHSEESLIKISESLKGKPSWNKDIPMREESKLKLSRSLKNADNPANHNRWHRDRGIYKYECKWCRNTK